MAACCLHAQVRQAGGQCDLQRTLGSLPSSLAAGLEGLRQLSQLLPAQVLVHAGSLADLPQWAWRPGATGSYIIAR